MKLDDFNGIEGGGDGPRSAIRCPYDPVDRWLKENADERHESTNPRPLLKTANTMSEDRNELRLYIRRR